MKGISQTSLPVAEKQHILIYSLPCLSPTGKMRQLLDLA
jgi:hypothetical protein